MTKLNENKKEKKNIFSSSKQNLLEIGYFFRDSFSFSFLSPPSTSEGEEKHETHIKSTSLRVFFEKVNTNTVVYV